MTGPSVHRNEDALNPGSRHPRSSVRPRQGHQASLWQCCIGRGEWRPPGSAPSLEGSNEARLCLAIGLVYTTDSPPVAAALAQDSRSPCGVDSKAAWSGPALHEAGPRRPSAIPNRVTRSAWHPLVSFAARAIANLDM